MGEKVIVFKGDTFDDARKQLDGLVVPEGYYLFPENIVCTGEKHRSDFTVEADSVEAARELIKSQTPEGFRVADEIVVSQGYSKALIYRGWDEEQAIFFAEVEAKSDAPEGSVIADRRVLIPGMSCWVSVAAFDEGTASSEALRQVPGALLATPVLLESRGRKGVLGIGKEPNQYRVKVVTQQCTVQVTCVRKAKVRAIVDPVDPQAVCTVTLVDADGLLDLMRAAAVARDGLWNFQPGAWSDRYYLLEALERIKDPRVASVLADYVEHHAYDAICYDSMDHHRREAVEKVLRSLEKIGDTSVRGKLIELIFAHAASFQHWYLPNLFGRFTPVLRALVETYKPVVVSSRISALENDGYDVRFRYDTGPLISAFRSLRAIENPVSSNLLHRLAQLPVFMMPRASTDRGDPGVMAPLEGTNLRQQAIAEIVRRSQAGGCRYDFSAYQIEEYY